VSRLWLATCRRGGRQKQIRLRRSGASRITIPMEKWNRRQCGVYTGQRQGAEYPVHLFSRTWHLLVCPPDQQSHQRAGRVLRDDVERELRAGALSDDLKFFARQVGNHALHMLEHKGAALFSESY